MARRKLSADDYIDATLELVDRIGVEAISMRRVAEHLGVSPMAAYRYFRDKEELLVRTLDAFSARLVVLPRDELPWDEWVDSIARAMYATLCEHPGWVPMIGSLRLGKNAAAMTRAFVDKLVGAGFTPEVALRGWYAVNQVVIGAACLGGPIGPPRPDTPAPADDGPRGAGPVVLALQDVLATTGTVEQIDIGLPLVIGALRAQLERGRAEPAKRRRG